MAERRVAVVGAGLAGLAAALELKEAGCEVTVFERSRLLGGRATSFDVGGREVDNGQHVFLACFTEFMRFARRLGMADALSLQDRFDVLVLSRRGEGSRLRAGALPPPWHLLTAFLRYRHLGWTDKLDVARALARVGEAGHAEGSFGAWLARLGQREAALRGFWRPFLVPALNAPLDRMSAVDAGFVLRTAFLSDAGAARLGYSTVPLAHFAAAAARRLDRVHLSAPVTGLDVRGGGVAVCLSGGDRALVDAVVVAVPPPQLGRLLGDPEEYGVRALDRYEARPIVDVHLWHDRGRLGFDLAALLDSPVQWVFEKAPGYVCCSLSAADDHVRRPTDETVRLCWDEVTGAIPALRGAQLLDARATRSPEGTFLVSPDVPRPGPRTRFPHVAIAGSWTDTGWPDTLESAVRSGLAAAQSLLGTAEGVLCATH
ncbi:MAG TPA: hydroxysqualene dehydroxylase HpnE [bacterium]|nr:hydroxysqualene dehydroxylase HpnE [bacterium]